MSLYESQWFFQNPQIVFHRNAGAPFIPLMAASHDVKQLGMGKRYRFGSLEGHVAGAMSIVVGMGFASCVVGLQDTPWRGLREDDH